MNTVRNPPANRSGSASHLELPQLVADIADAVAAADRREERFKQFQLGVGPYGEPQLVRLVRDHLNNLDRYAGRAETKRTPDLLIPGEWAVEIKIARPFGDNGRQAESWSVNLLHLYAGNVSLLGDCMKLVTYDGPERKAAVVIGYEHTPAQIDLDPLLRSFEALARDVLTLDLGNRVEVRRAGLRHPVHQQFTVAAWEVAPR